MIQMDQLSAQMELFLSSWTLNVAGGLPYSYRRTISPRTHLRLVAMHLRGWDGVPAHPAASAAGAGAFALAVAEFGARRC